MKTEISRIKIKQILKSYIKENKTSNIILEQNQDVVLKTKLQGMLSCFHPDIQAKVTKMSSDGNPNHDYSIKTSGITSGVRYWYIDGLVSVTDATTKNINFVRDTKTGEIKKWKVELCSQGKQSAGYTPQQNSFIESWRRTNVGAKEESELQGEERNTFTKKLASPKSERIFTEDFYMWLPPANLKSGSTITDAFKLQADAQTPTDNTGCKEAIKTFYDAYKNQLAIPPSDILTLNKQVKACRTRYYQKWGFLQGGRNLDKMLDELSKVTSTSPWFVTPERT